MARFVRERLLAAGLPRSAIRGDSAHRKSPHGGQAGNVIVALPGTVRAPRRLLSAHLDTVPLCVGCRPVRRGRQIVSADPATALGADDRAGTAALLVAALEMLERDLPRPPLTLLWTVQEEVGLVGARHVNIARLGRPAMGFNFDGGRPGEIVVGATGATRLEIEVRGIAAHAGMHPERGVSAIDIASRAIASLARDGWHGLIRKGARRGTSNVGVIRAGNATNVVADVATVRAEARSHDPRFRERVVAAYRKAFEAAARAVTDDRGRGGRVRVRESHDYEAFVLDRSAPCVRVAADVVAASGREATFRVVDGGLDANWLNAHGIPTVSLGAGQKQIHTVKESLDLAEFHAACRIALGVATGGA